MSIRVIVVEREYGSGGSAIARLVAERLQWKLWDEELTAEIARAAHVDHRAVQHCDEHVESLLSRLFKVYARGSYERALPIGDAGAFDTDALVAVLQGVIESVAARGECVIVGRGAPYILRNRPDVFSAFVYAPLEEKVHRLESIGTPQKEALRLIEEVDRDRAAFIRHYFGNEWPTRTLYNLMINSKFGDEYAAEAILRNVAVVDRHAAGASI